MRADKTKTYLQKYGYTIKTVVGAGGKYKYAVVVPAIAECNNIQNFLRSFSELDAEYFKDTLLLFVINNNAGSPSEVKEDNFRTIVMLDKIVHKQHSELTDRVISSGLNIAYIDVSSPGNELPAKDAGVGLARKIGMDACLEFVPQGWKGLLICTDADCTFGKNYLSEIIREFHTNDYDAAVINFRHNIDDEETADAVICYEIFLRYYVLGLKYSGSPFAFHTIGSAMACSSDAYINIEGMNKRKAAEDFYFLEKLAKKYPIAKINSTTVYPSSRKSWRVPFGTGQRVSRFLSRAGDEYMLYNPRCFEVLYEWHKIFFTGHIFSGGDYLGFAKGISSSLYEFLVSQGFEKDWDNILKNTKDPAGIMRHKVRWFDGFRTLKLIHYLRDNEFSITPMFDALDRIFEMYSCSEKIKRNSLIPGRSVQLEYLEKLRKLETR